MTDRLADAIAALDQLPVPVDWQDVEQRLGSDSIVSLTIDHSLTLRRRLVRRQALLILAAVAVLIVTVVVLWPGHPTHPVLTGPGPSASSRSASSSPSSSLPPSTVDPKPRQPTTTAPATSTRRTAAVTAFTGREYLVWAGEAGSESSRRADGFAIDVTTGAARPIPVAPTSPRSGATGVWTGKDLIVCCGVDQTDGSSGGQRFAAAWSPSTGIWRTLARPPEAVAQSISTSVWTGRVMVVIAPGPTAATYDPVTDRWAQAPAPPSIDRYPTAVWTGAEVVLWDPRFGTGSLPPDGAVADRGWRWAPGDAAWEPLPDLPPGSRTQLGSIGWSGTEIVVWGDSTQVEGLGVGARWRPGETRWRPMSLSPQGAVQAYDGTPGSQAMVSDPANGRVLVRALQGDAETLGKEAPLFAYNVTTSRWTTTGIIVPGFHPSIGVARDVVLVPDQARAIIGRAPP